MNKVFILILFLIFVLKFSSAQELKGIILDSKNKEAIPFAHITYKTKRVGASSVINGTFSLEKISQEDSLIVSAIGYEQKIIHFAELSRMDSILLKRKSVKLKEVNIKKKRYKSYAIKNTKADLRGLYITMRGNQIVTHIENNKLRAGYLKKITLFLKNRKGLKNVDLRLRIYEYDAINNIPGDDILCENFLFERKGNRTKIDLSKYNIFFPKKGLCVGFEWMDSKNITKGKRILVGPAACTNYCKRSSLKTWSSFRGRNWRRQNDSSLRYGDKVINLKIIAEVLL